MKSKKTLLLSALSILLATGAGAQTVTSTANGNWISPLTWDCTCVPSPGADIVVAHNVTLNTDWMYASGSLTINAGASLVQDLSRDLMITGGSFTNNGTFGIHYLLLQGGSISNTGTASIKAFANYTTFTNSGTLDNLDSLYNEGLLTNTGTILTSTFLNSDTLDNQGSMPAIDSMTNTGVLINAAGAVLEADSATNTGTLTNDGRITYSRMTNTGTFNNNDYLGLVEMTNIGAFENGDSIVATGSMVNAGSFNNHANAVLMLGKSFVNTNTLTFNASFTNDGYMQADGSWANFDNVSGSATGSFQVADTSSNFGAMSGNFDFCDLSIPFWVVSPPYMDYNSGTIGAGITWCTPVGVEQAVEGGTKVYVYPNPASGLLAIRGLGKTLGTARIYDTGGRELFLKTAVSAENNTLDLSGMPGGLYVLVVTGTEGRLPAQRISVQ